MIDKTAFALFVSFVIFQSHIHHEGHEVHEGEKPAASGYCATRQRRWNSQIIPPSKPALSSAV
jgi:hypothetical protein